MKNEIDQLPSLPVCFAGDTAVDGDQVDTGARKDITSDILQRLNVHYPICIVPDGNCFCRSISHLVYRSEHHHVEMRCRIVTDIYNDSNDLSTKESSGEKEVNSGVVNGPTQTKKKTLVKMLDLGPNSDCSESKSESKSEGESGTIIEHKISLQQEIKEPEISKTLVNYTESSDTSDDCPKNVERDLNTDSPNSKDPLIDGKLPPDAQPSSDCEEQDDISSDGKIGRKISRKEKK